MSSATASRRTADIVLLFCTRSVRLFSYGFLSVVLALYLEQIGLSDRSIGLLFTLTLAGDAVVSLWLTTWANRLGRRRTLLTGALLMIAAGAVFLFTSDPLLLTVAAIIGVISPSGGEIGPFLAVEQASLTLLVSDARRTTLFARYNLAGSFATAFGALAAGWLAQLLQASGLAAVASYRSILAGYVAGGALLFILFLFLSSEVELPPGGRTANADEVRPLLGLHRSRGIVFRLSALFSLDAFAGGFVVQSLIAFWFHRRFGVDAGLLGTLFFGANLLAGLSALLAGRIARRVGLVNTMVFTHIPSNLLLMLVPLMPSLPIAVVVLLVRFSISQMDVPTRQSYTMAVVEPDERVAASGVTTIARSVGAALSPSLSGMLMAVPALFGAPFLLAGGLKIVYDLMLFRRFRALKPPEER